MRVIEKQNLTGKTKFSSEWQEAIRKDLSEAKPVSLASFYQLCPRDETGKRVMEWAENRAADHTSHFITRLAYCRTEELRRWFVTHESDLFRFRWGFIKEEYPEEIQAFLATCGLNYEAISEEEKLERKDKLMAAAGFMSSVKFEDEKYYKVDTVANLIGLKPRFLSLGELAGGHGPRQSQKSLHRGRNGLHPLLRGAQPRDWGVQVTYTSIIGQ